MKMGQQMRLVPRMIQSMEILQMPLAELQERIEQELEGNATLERAEPDADEQGLDVAPAAEAAVEDRDRPMRVDEETGGEDFERLESFERANPEAAENEFSTLEPSAGDAGVRDFEFGSRPYQDGDRDGKFEAMNAAPARGASLAEQLRGQWALADVEDSLRPLGDLLISFLDEDGYLRTPLETIVERAPEDTRPTAAELERALSAMQLMLEPPGVAARNTKECLLLQLDAISSGEEGAGASAQTVRSARVLIEGHLDDLLQNRLPKVAEESGLSMEEIKAALLLMKRLNPAPGRMLVSDENRPIVPDAIVEYDPEQDRYIAYLNERTVPALRINQEYAAIAKNKATPKKDKEFLRTNLSNAQWLIDAVNQRKHTLLRVVRAVAEAQREFFDYGPQALKALPMTQVAEQLGIHVATVSRAVAEKYIATPRGVMPLRKFFSGGVQTKGAAAEGKSGGEEMAWDAIKAALREVIDAEDKKNPLSDDELVDELKKRGIEIARRTVAKYRDQLQIPVRRLRKQF